MSLTLTLKDNSGVPISDSGTTITLNDTEEELFTKFDLYGDLEQSTSPDPSSPQGVEVVSGEQTITITDGNSQSQEYNINLGKNLAKIEDCSVSDTGYSLTIDNGAVSITSTGTNNWFNLCAGIRDGQWIPTYDSVSITNHAITGADNGTYTLSLQDFNLSVVGSQNLYFSIFTNTRELRCTISPNSTSFTPYTFTLNSGEFVKTLSLWTGASDSSVSLSCKVQLERGSSKTSFSPYFTPIELCKIGDYQDYIYKDSGNWYIHKETNKINLQDYSGLAWWKLGSSIKITWEYMIIPNPLVPASMNEAGLTYSSHFTNGPAQEIWNGTRPVGYGLGPDGWYFNNNYSAAGDFTSFITDTPVLVYYVLDTATDTQITDSDLISQLDELLTEAHSYNGDTVLTSSSEYLSAIMDIVLGSVINEITYTEAELSNPLTITDVEGKSQNTTLDGNIYVDYAYNKKAFSVSIFNLRCIDYAIIRGFYDRQFTLGEFPTLTIPELCIYNMPVFFEIGRREINSQCIRTDKLELNFRETTQ